MFGLHEVQYRGNETHLGNAGIDLVICRTSLTKLKSSDRNPVFKYSLCAREKNMTHLEQERRKCRYTQA